MTAHGMAFFDAPIGRFGIAWSERGVGCVQLPEPQERALRARVLRRFPDAAETAPTTPVQRAIDGITALLRGEPVDLGAVVLDLDPVPAFDRRVYEAARAIPFGTTRTYGEIATRLGDAATARDVGSALGRNPFSIVVPCHRVVAASGRLGGFSAPGGVATKLRLLAIEGARSGGQLGLFQR